MQVCGAPLYDDFREKSHGSLARLQQMLDNPKGIPRSAVNGSSVQEATQLAGASLTAEPYSRGQESTTTATSGLYTGDENDTARGRQSEGLRHRGHTNPTLSTPITNPTWVLPIYHSDRDVMKVEHLAVSMSLSDLALFEMIKERYYNSRSKIHRILAMRGVKKVFCVKVCGKFPLFPKR